MKKKKQNHDWTYSGLAVALVAVVGFSMWWQLPIKETAADNVSEYTITVELGEDQPESVSQKLDQKVAQFKISTDSPKPVEINALEFHALGSLKSKIVRKLNSAPLRVRLDDAVLGEGDTWAYYYGRIQQIVSFEQPLTLDKDNPALVDVYADLFYQHDVTFGVALIGVESPLVVEGMWLNGYLYKIKIF
ncbi:hypothetical protein KKE14_00850 [Patescibacteria group bacterium]|nr:hypothetical protein [Patescibacteria group bacterium]